MKAPTPTQIKHFETMAKNTILETDEYYHSKRSEYTTSSSLKDFIKGPRHYFDKHLSGNFERIDTEAMYVGTLAHKVVLEGPHQAMLDYTFNAPQNSDGGEYGFRSQKFQNQRVIARSEGKELARQEDYKVTLAMRDAVHNHPIASELLRLGVAERVLRGRYKGMPVQIKMDWLCPYGIVDLKTSADIERFHNNSDYCDVHKFGYLHSASFYRRILAKANPGIPDQDFYFIVVEKKPPYTVGVWRVDLASLDHHQDENEKYMVYLSNSSERDVWPNPYEHLRTIEL